MEVRLTLQEFAEIGSHGFPRVSCYGHRGSQAGNGRNGRKWQKMAENGFSRVLSHGHRGGQAGNGRKWLKMAENGGKLISAGKWQKMDFRVFCAMAIKVAGQATAENG